MGEAGPPFADDPSSEAAAAGGSHQAAPPGWYADPSGQSAWRWWDGIRWTSWHHPPVGDAALAHPPMATADLGRPSASPPAEPVPAAQRRRLVVELCLVLAVFPLPYAVSAVSDLVSDLLGNGPGQRTPVLIKGHAAASFPFELILILLPFAAAGLVAYLLTVPGPFGSPRTAADSETGPGRGGDSETAPGETAPGEGGPGEGGLRALGLDFGRLKGDLALVLAVFFFCELLPIYGGGVLLHALGVHGVTPSTNGGPGYYVALDLLNGFTSGIVEEIVVLGFLVRRLEQLNLPSWAVVVIAVAVRGSYHLYYGWDVLAILAWATVTVVLYRRYRRLLPFIVVHVLWDTSLFVATSLPTRTGGVVLLTEAAALIPVSFVLWLMWRNQIPEPRSAQR